MQFIVFAGLPGTGKSSLAEAVGRRLGVPVFAKDWLEATLRRCGLAESDGCTRSSGYASYELLTTLAERQLAMGQSVILDSVASFERIRSQWRTLAERYGAQWRVVECTCTDEALHRERLTGRERGIPGWHELDWSEVERVRDYYEPWDEDRLMVDTAETIAENVAAVLAYLP
jgi:predicted kinase